MRCPKQYCRYLACRTSCKQARRSKTRILLAAALAALSACAPLAQVREVNPRLGAPPGVPSQLQRSERAVAAAENLKRKDPNIAVGLYLSGVESATNELRRHPEDRVALRDYDFALSRVFSVIRDAHLDPWTHSLHVPAPDSGGYVLAERRPANRLWKPQDFDLIPADELDVRGKLVLPRVTREGAGAPLVAVRSEQAPEIRQRFVPPRIYLAVTAAAHFSGQKVRDRISRPTFSGASQRGRSRSAVRRRLYCTDSGWPVSRASRESWWASVARPGQIR